MSHTYWDAPVTLGDSVACRRKKIFPSHPQVGLLYQNERARVLRNKYLHCSVCSMCKSRVVRFLVITPCLSLTVFVVIQDSVARAPHQLSHVELYVAVVTLLFSLPVDQAILLGRLTHHQPLLQSYISSFKLGSPSKPTPRRVTSESGKEALFAWSHVPQLLFGSCLIHRESPLQRLAPVTCIWKDLKCHYIAEQYSDI